MRRDAIMCLVGLCLWGCDGVVASNDRDTGQDTGGSDAGPAPSDAGVDARDPVQDTGETPEDVGASADAGDATDAGGGEVDVGPDATEPVDSGPLKAFPTAWGAGSDVTGGRGGQVIHVTTLDWDAPGGLREAIATAGPRTIVFDVSGVIDATSQGDFESIVVGSDFNDLTIAGQTAPEGGITVRTSEFMFRDVDNVIIRHVRFRQVPGSPRDAMWMTGVSKLVIDHCTFSHGGDEAASVSRSVGMSGEVTVQRSLFQDSKTGTILGVAGAPGDFTYAFNLAANISHRFPNPQGEGHYDIFNNVVYNWKNRLIRITGGGTYNIVDNVYKSAANGIRQPSWFGENGDLTPRLQKVQTQADDAPEIHAARSIIIPTQRPTPQADDRDTFTVFAGSHLTEGDPVPDSYFVDVEHPRVGAQPPTLTAAQAYDDVLADVGANRWLDADGVAHPYVDDYDAATLQMVRDDGYTGDFYDDRTSIPQPTVPENTRPPGFDTDRDGMPDAWELAQGFDPNDPSDHALDADGDGYTNLEEYLNGVDVR